MTPEATAMLRALNVPLSLNTPETNESVKIISSSINAVIDVFREILYSDEKMLKQIFLMNWSREEMYEIIANYLGTHPKYVMGSPERKEIIRFSAEMMTCEVLASIFTSVQLSCGLTLREFAITWRILNDSGEMRSILFDSVTNADLLHPNVKEAYLEEQMAKESEERIQKLMRDDFLLKKNNNNKE